MPQTVKSLSPKVIVVVLKTVHKPVRSNILLVTLAQHDW